MNPLTNVKNINKLNELEAQYGVSSSASWHQQYKDSAYIFVGGLPYELSEGDVLCMFSQYGEIVNINLVRDKKTGKSKGYCFIAYEDQRSTVLAVDNFNGTKLKGRILRVDHVSEYRKPKDEDDIDDATKKLREEGCAPKTPPTQSEEEDILLQLRENKQDYEGEAKKKKSKKEKKEKEKEKKKKKNLASSPEVPPIHLKQEREDTRHCIDARWERSKETTQREHGFTTDGQDGGRRGEWEDSGSSAARGKGRHREEERADGRSRDRESEERCRRDFRDRLGDREREERSHRQGERDRGRWGDGQGGRGRSERWEREERYRKEQCGEGSRDRDRARNRDGDRYR